MGYDSVIFDFDGVLLDSASDGFEWARKARRQRAEELGCEYNGDPYGYLFGANSFEEMKQMVENSDFTWTEYLDVEKTVARRKVELVRKGEMIMYPDAERVLKSINVPRSIVSNAYGDAVDEMVKALGIESYLDYWTAPRLAEIERYHSITKPETHMLEIAMEKMNTDRPVMVGDSASDIEAARNADIDSVLVERPHNRDRDLNSDHRITSLEELPELVSQR